MFALPTLRPAALLVAMTVATAGLAQVAPSGPPPDGAPAQSEVRPGANSFTEDQARSRLENAGYSEIGELRLDADGIWRGSAHYGPHRVEVSIDYRGAIVRR